MIRTCTWPTKTATPVAVWVMSSMYHKFNVVVASWPYDQRPPVVGVVVVVFLYCGISVPMGHAQLGAMLSPADVSSATPTTPTARFLVNASLDKEVRLKAVGE